MYLGNMKNQLFAFFSSECNADAKEFHPLANNTYLGRYKSKNYFNKPNTHGIPEFRCRPVGRVHLTISPWRLDKCKSSFFVQH